MENNAELVLRNSVSELGEKNYLFCFILIIQQMFYSDLIIQSY